MLRVESSITALLAPLTPTDPIVAAALVGSDLVITCCVPRGQYSRHPVGGSITVEGLPRPYYAAPNGTLTTLQTDINNSGVTSQTFTPSPAYTATSPVRDLKIKLSGVDSEVQVGDQSGDGVNVGREI